MKEELTLDNFKRDYVDMVTEFPNAAIRMGVAERLISRFYIHIRTECIDWVKKEYGLKLFA